MFPPPTYFKRRIATHTNTTSDRIHLCPPTGEEVGGPDAVLAFFLRVRLEGHPALTADDDDDDDDGLSSLTARQRAELAALVADARGDRVSCSIHHH